MGIEEYRYYDYDYDEKGGERERPTELYPEF